MIDLPPDSTFVADTPRLRLVPLTVAHAEEMFLLLNDQRLHVFTGGLPLGKPELIDLFRRWEGRRSTDGKTVLLNWVVRLVPLGEAIGHMQATVTDGGEAVLGWTIGTRWQGYGFATEAASAMVRLLAAHVGVVRIEAHVAPLHIASQRVAAGLGMTRTGVRRADGEDLWAGTLEVAAEVPATAVPAWSAHLQGRRRPRVRRATGTSG